MTTIGDLEYQDLTDTSKRMVTGVEALTYVLTIGVDGTEEEMRTALRASHLISLHLSAEARAVQRDLMPEPCTAQTK